MSKDEDLNDRIGGTRRDANLDEAQAMTIVAHVRELDPLDDRHWSPSGLPKLTIVRDRARVPSLSRQELTDITMVECQDGSWQVFDRQFAAELKGVELPDPTPEVEEEEEEDADELQLPEGVELPEGLQGKSPAEIITALLADGAANENPVPEGDEGAAAKASGEASGEVEADAEKAGAKAKAGMRGGSGSKK